MCLLMERYLACQEAAFGRLDVGVLSFGKDQTSEVQRSGEPVACGLRLQSLPQAPFLLQGEVVTASIFFIFAS